MGPEFIVHDSDAVWLRDSPRMQRGAYRIFEGDPFPLPEAPSYSMKITRLVCLLEKAKDKSNWCQ